MNALEKIRQRNRLHAQLQSGLDVAYHLPDAARHIAEVEEIQRSDLFRFWELKHRIVADMLEALDGEEITERDDRRAIVAALTPAERIELYDLAQPPPEKITPVPLSPDDAATVEEGWARAAAENRRILYEGSRE